MKFLKAAKLVGQPEELNDKQIETLHRNIETFLLAGGTISLDDWTELENVERSAFAFVNSQMDIIQMGIQALAYHDVGFAIDCLSEGDGGELRELGLLSAVAKKAAKVVKGRIN